MSLLHGDDPALHVTSGAGSKSDPVAPDERTIFAREGNGYVWIRFERDLLRVEALTRGGGVAFSHVDLRV